MRSIQISPVYDRADRRNQLKRSNSYALTEAYPCQVSIFYILAVRHYSGRIRAVIYACGLTEAKVVNILVELLRPHFQRKLHEYRIAAVRHAFHQCLRTMGVPRTPAFNLLSVHRLVSAAIKRAVQRSCSAVQRRSRSYYLKCRSGLVSIHYGCILRYGCQLYRIAPVQIVQIRFGIVHHPQHTSVVGIHDYSNYFLRLVYFIRFLSRRFCKALYIHIQSQIKIQSVLRFNIHFLPVGQLSPACVHERKFNSVISRQVFIIRFFQALLSVPVCIRVSQNLTHECAVGVIALRISKEIHSRQIELAYCRRLFVCDLALEPNLCLACILRFF